MINGRNIPFSECAEHVGIIRSVDGNLPNIVNRIKAHRKALGAVLFTGLAQRHRANPAVGLKIERIYGSPVLMSGLASQVLLGSELTLLDQHCKKLTKIFKSYIQKRWTVLFTFWGAVYPLQLKSI